MDINQLSKKSNSIEKIVSLNGDEFPQINSVVNPILKSGRTENPPQFVIFTGGVGSGKTTIRHNEFLEGYVNFDSWEIYIALKNVFGKDHPKLSTYANLACGMILKEAIADRKNVVIEIIGDNYKQFTSVTDKMKEIGYSLSIRNIVADPLKSYERHLKLVQDDPDYLSAFYTQEATLAYFHQYFNLLTT